MASINDGCMASVGVTRGRVRRDRDLVAVESVEVASVRARVFKRSRMSRRGLMAT